MIRNDQDLLGLYLGFLGMAQGFRNTFRISKKSIFKPLRRSPAHLWQLRFQFGQDRTGMIRIVRVYIWNFSARPKESETLFGFPKSRFLSLSGASPAHFNIDLDKIEQE